MREEDEIRAAVIELARAQAAGEDIADALPHGEALATAGAAADGEVADVYKRQASYRVPANGRLPVWCPRR